MVNSCQPDFYTPKSAPSSSSLLTCSGLIFAYSSWREMQGKYLATCHHHQQALPWIKLVLRSCRKVEQIPIRLHLQLPPLNCQNQFRSRGFCTFHYFWANQTSELSRAVEYFADKAKENEEKIIDYIIAEQISLSAMLLLVREAWKTITFGTLDPSFFKKRSAALQFIRVIDINEVRI